MFGDIVQLDIDILDIDLFHFNRYFFNVNFYHGKYVLPTAVYFFYPLVYLQYSGISISFYPWGFLTPPIVFIFSIF